MHPFLKAQASSLAASVADFSTTIVLVEVFKCWYLAASVTGTIVGGITNFLVNRNWVFDGRGTQHYNADEDLLSGKEKSNTISIQAVRYLLVWTGNLVLNAAGVYLLTHYVGVSYMISKVFVSVLVGFTYNYLLQKRFVFSKG
jgi:putative flippase GtrA